MKTKHWILLLAAVFALCLGLSLFFLVPGTPATQAQVRSDGALVCTIDLAQEQTFTITTADGGSNTITVQDGKIAVTAASCPDHYCMARGYCNSGAQIVCLPNRLTITFVGETEIDAAIG